MTTEVPADHPGPRALPPRMRSHAERVSAKEVLSAGIRIAALSSVGNVIVVAAFVLASVASLRHDGTGASWAGVAAATYLGAKHLGRAIGQALVIVDLGRMIKREERA